MDQHKPLSYQSLKTVIQYMDVNFRLVKLRQIPSLCKNQKVVPLRLGVLELNHSKFIFDNIKYSYSPCRKFIKRDGGPVTELYSQYDINNDGEDEIFQDLMPGDIVIKDRDWRGGFFSNKNKKFISDSYVKFSVWTGLNKRELSGQSPYGIRVRDMMRKKLHEVLGGKRIHQVEHLKIGVYHGVLRLPEGLKLKIRELSIVRNNMSVIDAILPILDVSSFPLKSLSIGLLNPEDPVIKSEILRTSELLNIIGIGGLFDNRWTNLLINLPNMKIHLENGIPLKYVVPFVRNWMKHPRVIGTRLSMQVIWVKEHLNEIVKEFKPVERILPKREYTTSFLCFTLPMTSTSELNIYRAKSPNHEEELKKEEETMLPYMVVMEVMPIGTSKPLKLQ